MAIADSLSGRRGEPAERPNCAAPQAIESALLVAGAPLFQQIVESSASCVMVIDAAADDQPILYASPALQKLMGYSISELVGVDWKLFLKSRDNGSQPQALRLAVRGRSVTREILCAQHGDGTVLYVDVRFGPLYDDRGFTTLRVAILHDVTTEYCTREMLAYRACHDPLTGLPNRYLLLDHFERAVFQAQRHGIGFTIVLLDLDGFKRINDRHGHAAGDDVLRAVGARLKRLVRGEDTVARWGGDEFVLILTESGGGEAVQTALARIRESLVRSSEQGAESRGLEVRCSFGTARYPEDAETVEALLETADRRLYTDKARRARGGLRPGTAGPGKHEALPHLEE